MSNIELIEKTLPVAPLKIAAMESCIAVSYTHLDVYKRQALTCVTIGMETSYFSASFAAAFAE